MLTFIRQPTESIKNILLANLLSFSNTFPLSHLSNYAASRDGSTATVCHKGSLSNTTILYLEPDFHGIPAMTRNTGKTVSIFNTLDTTNYFIHGNRLFSNFNHA